MNPATRFHPAHVLSAVLTVGAWAAALVVIVLAFSFGGSSGFFAGAQHGDIGAEDVVGFSITTGSLSLLIALAMAAAPQFLSADAIGRIFGRSALAPDPASPRARHLPPVVALISLVTAVLVALSSTIRHAWWIWLTALALGLLIRLLLSRRSVTLKPWRMAGLATGGMFFLACAFQVFGGAGSGLRAVVLVSIIAAILLALGGIASFFVRPPSEADESDQLTGAFPVRAHEGTRNPSDVRVPWVPYALYGVLGAVLAVSQPMMWELGYGQAGFALIASVVLIGWAVGFESGPSVVPGMSRPRATAIALLLAGLLLILMGLVTELSGLTLFAGAAAWCVGAGSRAQEYHVNRRLGFIIGVVVTLVLVAVDLATEVILSESVTWIIYRTEGALLVVGVAALVAGIVAVLTFDPHGLRGLGVDLIYAFQSPAAARRRRGTGQVPTETHVPSRGIFVVLEGGDGSGKSTQAKLLAERLREDAGVPVTLTREPGGTPEGAKIRRVILDGEGVTPRSEALLYAADRSHHVASLVKPALDSGSVVVADRYIDSSLAYQSAGRELEADDVRRLSTWGTEGLLPNLTIVLDIDPDAALARTDSRGERDHLERQAAEFHTRVREKYLAMAEADPARYLVVDANRPTEEIATDLYRIVSNRALTARERGIVAALPAARQGGDDRSAAAEVPEHDTTVIPRPDDSADGSHGGPASAAVPGAGGARGDGTVSGHDAEPSGDAGRSGDPGRSDDSGFSGHAGRSAEAGRGGVADGADDASRREAPRAEENGGARGANAPGEAETTVVPQQATAGDSGESREAETTVVPQQVADPTPSDEGRTTVVPQQAASNGPDDSGEAETTVVPQQRRSNTPSDEAETTAVPQQRGDDTPSREAETTVLPAHGATAPRTEAPRTERPASDGDDVPGGSATTSEAEDPGEAATTAMPAQQPPARPPRSQASRERLLAQARLEREARDRLRQVRRQPPGDRQ